MNRSQQLDWLINELLPTASIPNNLDEKWRLFRALVNARKPDPMKGISLAIQDEFLQSIIADKGITNIHDLHPVRDNIYLWRGDITTLKVGAIVNAANSGMLGCFIPNHACIDNAIHTFAGVQLRMECANIMKQQEHPEPTGQVKITAAYNLPSRYILHTVGPIVDGQVTEEHKRLLASCYRSCLEIAEKNEIESVAFCCISTGEFRFPNEGAARIAVDTVNEHLTSCVNVKRVVFNVFNEPDEHIYERLLR